MSRVPFMPFFGNDFFGSSRVRLMSAEEKVAYLTLLWFQWVDDGLPVASDDLRKLTTDLSETVLDCFPVARDNRRRNPALEHHRRRSKTMSSAQSKRAKSRWDIRKDEMPDACPDDAQNMPSVSVSVSVPEVSSEGKPSGEADRKDEPNPGVNQIMGAIRTFGYRRKTTRSEEFRDHSVARAMLAAQPLEDCLRAIEGTRLLADSGNFGNDPAPGGHFGLRLVWYTPKEGGGRPVFSNALDAYYTGSRTVPTKRQHSQPTGIADVLGTMGVA